MTNMTNVVRNDINRAHKSVSAHEKTLTEYVMKKLIAAYKEVAVGKAPGTDFEVSVSLVNRVRFRDIDYRNKRIWETKAGETEFHYNYYTKSNYYLMRLAFDTLNSAGLEIKSFVGITKDRKNCNIHYSLDEFEKRQVDQNKDFDFSSLKIIVKKPIRAITEIPLPDLSQLV